MFARATDVPGIVSDALPDGKYCTIDDAVKAFRKVEKHLLTMNPSDGHHFVLLCVNEVRSLILTLVLADTAVGLDDSLDPSHEIAVDHTILKDTVQDVRGIIAAAQGGTISYEEVRDRVDNLPRPALANAVLSLIGQQVSIVQSLAGPIDLHMDKLAVKQVASAREHCLQGRVSGGYDEQVGTVIFEVCALHDADPRLFSVGTRITLKVGLEEHRVNLLLAQLAKVQLKVRLKIPRVPILGFTPATYDLKCDLEHMEMVDKAHSFEEIRATLARQLHLEL